MARLVGRRSLQDGKSPTPPAPRRAPQEYYYGGDGEKLDGAMLEEMREAWLCRLANETRPPPPPFRQAYGVEALTTPDDTTALDEVLYAVPPYIQGDALEMRYNDARTWSWPLRALISGTGGEGDPHSQTGMLTGVAPMLLHRPTKPHPERPARLIAIYDELIRQDLLQRTRLFPLSAAECDDLSRVHSKGHRNRVVAQYAEDSHMRKELRLTQMSDTYVTAGATGRAASLASGSVVDLTRRVVAGELRNAFALVRPPGHHAEQHAAMGFCLFNSVAVAAAAARKRFGVARVMIIDWDVHHGNGIQHIFEDDREVLYLSLHRYSDDFFPGTGGPAEVGFGMGAGFSINIAWSSGGMGDAEYLAAFARLVIPVANEFAPDLVFISAGFDAAAGDPLGDCEVSPEGYAHMTSQLMNLNKPAPVIVVLEGGYSLTAISISAAAVLRVLLGDPLPPLPPTPPTELQRPSKSARRDIERAMKIQSPFWHSMRTEEAWDGWRKAWRARVGEWWRTLPGSVAKEVEGCAAFLNQALQGQLETTMRAEGDPREADTSHLFGAAAKADSLCARLYREVKHSLPAFPAVPKAGLSPLPAPGRVYPPLLPMQLSHDKPLDWESADLMALGWQPPNVREGHDQGPTAPSGFVAAVAGGALAGGGVGVVAIGALALWFGCKGGRISAGNRFRIRKVRLP